MSVPAGARASRLFHCLAGMCEPESCASGGFVQLEENSGRDALFSPFELECTLWIESQDGAAGLIFSVEVDLE